MLTKNVYNDNCGSAHEQVMPVLIFAKSWLTVLMVALFTSARTVLLTWSCALNPILKCTTAKG